MRGIPSDPTNNSTLLLEDFGGIPREPTDGLPDCYCFD